MLAAILPGRVERLALTQQQKRLLRDPEGQLALHILRHVLGARSFLGLANRFPLVGEFFQKAARKCGEEIGVHRCYHLIRRLRETQVIHGGGSYCRPFDRHTVNGGYRPRLY